MRKIFLGLIASTMLLSVASFAQTMSQAPASWIAFRQQEKAKREAFYKQLAADREAFLNANPEVKTYLDQLRATAKARMAQRRAEHPNKNYPAGQPVFPKSP